MMIKAGDIFIGVTDDYKDARLEIIKDNQFGTNKFTYDVETCTVRYTGQNPDFDMRKDIISVNFKKVN